jgi:hypothetical protein
MMTVAWCGIGFAWGVVTTAITEAPAYSNVWWVCVLSAVLIAAAYHIGALANARPTDVPSGVRAWMRVTGAVTADLRDAWKSNGWVLVSESPRGSVWVIP